MERDFTLSKTERLKSRKLIEQLFRKGRSFSYFPLKVVYDLPQDGVGSLRAGFTVSAKNFKKAVDRNRIKRVMRESYRLQKGGLKQYLDSKNKFMPLFFIYTGNVLPAYQTVFEKMTQALSRLEKIIDESASANS